MRFFFHGFVNTHICSINQACRFREPIPAHCLRANKGEACKGQTMNIRKNTSGNAFAGSFNPHSSYALAEGPSAIHAGGTLLKVAYGWTIRVCVVR